MEINFADKVNYLEGYCSLRNQTAEVGESPCFGCPIEKPCSHCYGEWNRMPNMCDEAYDYLKRQEVKPIEDTTEVTEVTHDPVNHPKHYCREGAMECIDEMVLIFGKEAVKHFCICNAWKYRARAMDKNGTEDLKKSDWYIKKFKELNDGIPNL